MVGANDAPLGIGCPRIEFLPPIVVQAVSGTRDTSRLEPLRVSEAKGQRPLGDRWPEGESAAGASRRPRGSRHKVVHPTDSQIRCYIVRADLDALYRGTSGVPMGNSLEQVPRKRTRTLRSSPLALLESVLATQPRPILSESSPLGTPFPVNQRGTHGEQNRREPDSGQRQSS